jgi:hypothetical protein
MKPSCVLAAAAAAFALSPFTLHAHQAPSGWSYPVRCCSGIDCGEIPASAVKEPPQGYRITLKPGDHVMVKAPFETTVPYAAAKPARDGAYHICLSPALKVLCFFAGPRGA